jgi:hypothetical protein
VPDQPDAPRVLSLSVRPQPEREFIISRQDDGTYAAEEKIYKVSPRIVRVEGERNGSLEQSGMRAGAPSPAMIEFVRALSYDVDFQRELKQGQKFTVLLEQLVTSDGRVTHPGRLLAGELRLLKRTVTVIRFRPPRRRRGFLQPAGRERRAFLFAHARWMPPRSRPTSACASIRSWASAPCMPASTSPRQPARRSWRPAPARS